MIKWCLNLKLLSSSAYHSLKTSGILVLPSERTLRDYTHWMRSDAGFSDSVDEQLLKEVGIDSSVTLWDFQRHVCLVFDEVKIKEDLVYDKHSCQIIGFVNLGHVNNQLLELERSEKGEPEESIAKNIVMFMVRGLFSKLEYPYAQFPCASLSADLIFPLVWKCVNIAMDSNDMVYVVDDSHRVYVFTPGEQLVTSFGRQGRGKGEFNLPLGMAVDSSGVVYVCDYCNNHVQLF